MTDPKRTRTIAAAGLIGIASGALADPGKSGWMTCTIHILDGGRSLL
jgi:hypothetical protein